MQTAGMIQQQETHTCTKVCSHMHVFYHGSAQPRKSCHVWLVYCVKTHVQVICTSYQGRVSHIDVGALATIFVVLNFINNTSQPNTSHTISIFFL
eukprot:c37738_g1_i1 orf=245-529(-)